MLVIKILTIAIIAVGATFTKIGECKMRKERKELLEKNGFDFSKNYNNQLWYKSNKRLRKEIH